MSIQNRVADQRADRDRQLLHIIAEELKKQNGMIQPILDILTGYGAFSSPPPPSAIPRQQGDGARAAQGDQGVIHRRSRANVLPSFF